jgi:hypothetical protein
MGVYTSIGVPKYCSLAFSASSGTSISTAFSPRNADIKFPSEGNFSPTPARSSEYITVPSLAQSLTRAVRSDTIERCTNSWNRSYRSPTMGVSRSAGVMALRSRPDEAPTASSIRSSIACAWILSARMWARITAMVLSMMKLAMENWSSRFSFICLMLFGPGYSLSW